MTEPGAATEALRLAQQALTRQDGHDELCQDRWGELRKEISNIKRQQWAFVTLILGAQGGLIVFLLERLPAVVR